MPNKPSWRPNTRGCFILYLLCVALLMCSLILIFIPNIFDFLKKIFFEHFGNLEKEFLQNFGFWWNNIEIFLLDPTAIQKVINSIGVTAIALTWLVNANQQKVYGISIGTLLRWACPGFFRFYFTVFLSLYFICAYTCSFPKGQANSQIKIAMAFSYIGILVSTFFFLYIAYTFVLNFERRQDIALSYHYYHVEWIKGLKFTNSIKCKPFLYLILICKGVLNNEHPNQCLGFGENTTACFQGIDECISLLGKSVGQRMIEGEPINVSDFYMVWKSAFSYYQAYMKAYIKKSSYYDIYSLCFLAERFWSLALPKSMILSEQIQLAKMLLCETLPIDTEESFYYDWSTSAYSKDPKKVKSVEIIVRPFDCFAVGFLLSFNQEGLSESRLQQIIPTLFSAKNKCGSRQHTTQIMDFMLPALTMGYLIMCWLSSSPISAKFKNSLKESPLWDSSMESVQCPNEKKTKFEDFFMTAYNAYVLENGYTKKTISARDITDRNKQEDLMSGFRKMANDALEGKFNVPEEN